VARISISLSLVMLFLLPLLLAACGKGGKY